MNSQLRSTTASLLAALGLAACATPQAPPAEAFVAPADRLISATAPAPSSPGAARVSFDGNYSGTIRTTANFAAISKSWCDTPPHLSLSVKNNAFTYVLAHPNVAGSFSRTFRVTIDPNGSFSAQTADGSASMTGQITETRMAGQISGEGCGYAFTAQQS